MKKGKAKLSDKVNWHKPGAWIASIAFFRGRAHAFSMQSLPALQRLQSGPNYYANGFLTKKSIANCSAHFSTPFREKGLSGIETERVNSQI